MSTPDLNGPGSTVIFKLLDISYLNPNAKSIFLLRLLLTKKLLIPTELIKIIALLLNYFCWFKKKFE